jgi:serine/threonine protein kinase
MHITDFGLSRLADKGLTDPNAGTPKYLAPEARTSDKSTSSSADFAISLDIYAFGVLIYVLLTGMVIGSTWPTPKREPPTGLRKLFGVRPQLVGPPFRVPRKSDGDSVSFFDGLHEERADHADRLLRLYERCTARDPRHRAHALGAFMELEFMANANLQCFDPAYKFENQ